VKAVTVKEAALPDIVILAVPFPAVPDAVISISDWGGRIINKRFTVGF
jgi:predicted dinucleotide-binding enzyme